VRLVVNLRCVRPRVVARVAHPKRYFCMEILIYNYAQTSILLWSVVKVIVIEL
jgi:hypothetical protein